MSNDVERSTRFQGGGKRFRHCSSTKWMLFVTEQIAVNYTVKKGCVTYKLVSSRLIEHYQPNRPYIKMATILTFFCLHSN